MATNKTINFNFKNKKILVLGASGGLGLKITKDFINSGAYVYGVSRKKIHINSKLFNNILMDLNNISEDVLETNLLKIKNIDFLINSYAITEKSKLILQSSEIFEKTIKNNLFGYYNFLLKIQKKIKNNGNIVNITSINSKFAFEKNPSYQISKAALSSLTKSLAKDLSHRNIRVNSIAPSYIKTKMTLKSFQNYKKRNLISKKNFLNRWGNPKEISSVVLFLCSEGASFITGQEIFVDGGWSVNGGF